MATEVWFCPSSSGQPAEPKVGPGQVSTDINLRPDVDVLRFVKGYLTIDTDDPRYPLWRSWLDMSASAYGLRLVPTVEYEATQDPTAIPCPISETCPWVGPAAGHDWHILAHRPPDGEFYEAPKRVTYGTGY
jgi:hypothetical protein